MYAPEGPDEPDDQGSSVHVCLAYDTAAEFRAWARRFLVEGLAQGQRVWYVAAADLTELRDELIGLEGYHPAAARVLSLDTAYPASSAIDPLDQVREYAEATTEALAQGFTGLRVAADATKLIGSARQLDAFARYEHLIDRYLVTHPFSALCAYDRGVLGAEAVAQVACLHPRTNDETAPFRLVAAPAAAAALGGELDTTGIELFLRAADRAELTPTHGELVLDASELSFIDHRGLFALDQVGRNLNSTVVLRTSLRTARRLLDLLDLERVRVEVPTP